MDQYSLKFVVIKLDHRLGLRFRIDINCDHVPRRTITYILKGQFFRSDEDDFSDGNLF